MSTRETETVTRPEHGCARCIWWQQTSNTRYGKCHIWREKMYFQAPPCPEYEMDSNVPDTITVQTE